MAWRGGTGSVTLISTTRPEFGLRRDPERNGGYIANFELSRRSTRRLVLNPNPLNPQEPVQTDCICNTSAVDSRFFCDMCDRKMHQSCPCAQIVEFNSQIRQCFECLGQSVPESFQHPDQDRKGNINKKTFIHTCVIAESKRERPRRERDKNTGGKII